jgi:DNA-binding winged helix-turn-helix (wHTH) protein
MSRDRVLVLKEELIESVWAGTFVEEGSLTQAISILRKTLGQQSIRTIPTRGYCYVGPVLSRMKFPPHRM